MTFSKFAEIFQSHYPEASLCMHGEFGGTERNKKVAIAFADGGKVYEYYGAYADILCKCGIKVYDKSRFDALESRLAMNRKVNGTEDFFGGTINCEEEIIALEKEIEDIKKNYIIA